MRISDWSSDVCSSDLVVNMDRRYSSANDALRGLLRDGMTLCVGGFGLCGIPERLIDAVLSSGVRDLTVVSNNAGVDGEGLGKQIGRASCRERVCQYV